MKVIFWMSNGFDKHFTSEHLFVAVIKALVSKGNIVHILQMNSCDNNPTLPDYLNHPNITTSSVFFSAPSKSSFVKRYISELKWHMRCKSELKKYRNYDALFIQSTNVAGFAVRLARRVLGKDKIITFNVQDIFPYNAFYSGKIKKNSIKFKVLSFIQRYGYNHSDHIITISEDMKETLVSDGVDPNKIEVIYNWSYQDEIYKNLDCSAVSHMFRKNYFNVVYAGNIGVMQNVDIIIETANLSKEDNDLWFHIIGDGINKNNIIAKAKSYGIKNISFWPMQPSEYAPLIYYSADVNIIPLIKGVYRTALPSKTATCFACQKPIVFAIGNESKFGKRVMNETGCFVVESDSAAALLDAILCLKQRPDFDNRLGEFYSKYLSNSKNSNMYAEIITRRK